MFDKLSSREIFLIISIVISLNWLLVGISGGIESSTAVLTDIYSLSLNILLLSKSSLI